MAEISLLDQLLAKDRGELNESESDWDANPITEYIYLGSEDADIAPKQELDSRGISHILVCGFGLQSPHTDHYVYLKLNIVDLPIQPLTDQIPNCVKFIESARSAGGKVLVHCARGVSRSAAVMCGCLMTMEGISFQEAYHRVRSKRPCVSINSGFKEQLLEYKTTT